MITSTTNQRLGNAAITSATNQRNAKTVCDEHIRDLHAACKLMGVPVSSADRFVRQAIEYLASVAPLEIFGDDNIGWIVRRKAILFPGFSCGGCNLMEALVGAIFCVNEPKE